MQKQNKLFTKHNYRVASLKASQNMKLQGSLFIVLVLLFAACSPQKKLARIMHKHPYLFTNTTQTLVDTFILSSFSHDTIWHHTKQKDTLYLKTERFTQTIIRNGDDIQSKTDIPTDTFYKELKVPVFVPNTEKTPTFWQKKISQYIGYILIFLGIVLLIKLFHKNG